MKEIIMYQSDSGVKYSTKYEAEKEDIYYAKMQDILKLLPSTEKIDFNNGEGYLQCDADKVEYANKLYLLATSDYFQQNFTNVHGIVGRYVSDSSSRAFNEVQYKLQSIDSKYRMWGQVYYAINANKGKNICLNP